MRALPYGPPRPTTAPLSNHLPPEIQHGSYKDALRIGQRATEDATEELRGYEYS